MASVFENCDINYFCLRDQKVNNRFDIKLTRLPKVSSHSLLENKPATSRNTAFVKKYVSCYKSASKHALNLKGLACSLNFNSFVH